MIGHFPPPYADETLHSVMGRLAGRVPPPSTKAAIREAYNKTTITAVVDLPAELTALSVSIPATMGITAEGLILDHTLWPFFAAFQASEKRDRSKRELLEGGHPYLRLGLMSSRCPFPKYLRYCPYCVLEDRRRFRETYWRRTLQIPGVVVCPVHGTRLQLSSVPLRHLRNRHEFISAESAIGDVDGEWQRGTDLERFMAESAAWLLKHPDSHCTHDDLQNAFEQSYSIEFLREAGCESETSGTWWVLRLLRKPRGYQHPLRYVLLLHFVGSSPNHFFASGPLSHPFGRAPWPCLNLLSGHYGALTIEDCEWPAPPGTGARWLDSSRATSAECSTNETVQTLSCTTGCAAIISRNMDPFGKLLLPNESGYATGKDN